MYMNVIGIVCEYNPFHNGHLYQIKKVKEMYPESIIIVCLNGYYMERGEISYMSKENKVKASLDNDVDIVVELPFIYGIQSADTFAYQSIKILSSLGIDTLVFGSESNDISYLKDIANKQNDEDFKKLLNEEFMKGISYSSAYKNVLGIDKEIYPNDLLGISYIKAINKINNKINPVCIKRTSDYHDLDSTSDIISAENIRNKYDNNLKIDKYTNYSNYINKIDYDTYFKILKNKINTLDNLDIYVDINEGVENRLKKYINNVDNIIDFIKLVKTKRYSYNKINRMLINILVGFKKIDNIDLLNIRILGFNKNGKKYLNSIKYDNTYNKLVKDYELKASMM